MEWNEQQREERNFFKKKRKNRYGGRGKRHALQDARLKIIWVRAAGIMYGDGYKTHTSCIPVIDPVD